MEIVTKITSDDIREKRESNIYKFHNKEDFYKFLDEKFMSHTYSFNSIITTHDNKILLLKRKNSFAVDKLYNYITSYNKKINYCKIINHIKNLFQSELLMIMLTIDELDLNISELKIREKMFRIFDDKKLTEKIFVISCFIRLKYRYTFYKIYNTTNDKISRIIKTDNLEITITKEKDIYVLPGGRKSKFDKNFKETLYREIFEELGKRLKFELSFDYYHIIISKIYDKVSSTMYNDITLICSINKNINDIINNFRTNEEISNIVPILSDSSFCGFNEIKKSLLSVLKLLN